MPDYEPDYHDDAPNSRVLPHSAEAEEGLISCCLIDGGQALQKAQEAGIRGDLFYAPGNSIIFSLLSAMKAEGKPIDVAALHEELRRTSQIEAVGGLKTVLRIAEQQPTTSMVGYYVERVMDLANRRSLIRSATGVVEDVFDLSKPLDEILQHLNLSVRSIGRASTAQNAFTVWQPAAFREWEPPVNINLLGGGYLRRRQLTTLIGPPGVGKSRLSMWLACMHITGRNFFGLDTTNGPAKWLFFGNENDPLRQKTDLAWFYQRLTKVEQDQVDANLFLHVIDKPDDGIITLADPEAFGKLNSTLAHFKPDVVVFDPWGNMIEGNENDNEEVRRTLKLLLRAIANNCPDAASLVIHHARTGRSTAIEAGNNFSGGSLGRGSKALVSAARCELALWPGHSEDSNRLVLTCEKVNNVKKFEPIGLRFENGVYGEDPEFSLSAWRDDINGVRSGKTLTISDLVDIVRRGVSKAADICEIAKTEFAIGRSTVMTRLREACESGYLEKTIPAGSYIISGKAPRIQAEDKARRDRTQAQEPEDPSFPFGEP